ncbi:PLD nuclease N-terminal domain-containing protein [Demequina litorisediminis]|uniref:Cardiolipin synthase N-terminal domain-containing protein n=1 Tax=Demequina litorisediminis TaxID=1849022 RepID=A0ABQ6ICB4_9MICO|nr:hypothetical protein GCM10025876_16760 [Demequina litorisediminis]
MEFFKSFLDLLFFSLWIFVLVAFFMVLFRVIVDIFRDSNLGGFSKTLWLIAVLIFPFLGILIYLIARGKGMARRDVEQAASVRAAQVEYTKGLMSEAGPASEIKAAKEPARLRRHHGRGVRGHQGQGARQVRHAHHAVGAAPAYAGAAPRCVQDAALLTPRRSPRHCATG